MPTKGKTAPAQNMQKWQRMKTIQKELKVCSRTSSELEKIIFDTPNNSVNRRSLQNYLLELMHLELIIFDPTTGRYALRENKQTFQSKADYDLALTHSYNIFFYKVEIGTDYEGEDTFFPNERIVLLNLAFYEEDKQLRKHENEEWEKENRDHPKVANWGTPINDLSKEDKQQEDDSYNPVTWKPVFRRINTDLGENSDYKYAQNYLLQHIKTGYPEIFELIKKYKQFLIEHGVTSGYVVYKSPGLIEKRPGIPAIKVTKNEKQEVENIETLFAGKLRRLSRDVIDKIPLLGYCDGCPTARLTIKDKQEE